MKQKTYYICEICGASSLSKKKIRACEKSHKPHSYKENDCVLFRQGGDTLKGVILKQTYKRRQIWPCYIVKCLGKQWDFRKKHEYYFAKALIGIDFNISEKSIRNVIP